MTLRDSLEARKQALRTEILARLSRLPDASPALGARVAQRVAELPEYRDARLVVLYAAISGELPTRQLLDAAQDASRSCALPCVLPGRRLELRVAPRWENLCRGRYGLLEPEGGAEVVSIGDADLVLVPGLAFDARGGRLGRGGGYYDRALGGVARRALPPLFGLAHDWQVVAEVPCGERDVRVDGVVTEIRVLRVGGQGHR